MKQHYTYELRHKAPVDGEPYRYIGVHSCEGSPFEEVSYWGTSKHLPKDIAVTHKKLVLQVFPTREEAMQHEIMLHDKYDVGVNPDFYNRAKQTSTKFDMTGCKRSEETRKKMSASKSGENHPMFGKQSPEHAAKLAGTYDLYIRDFFGKDKHLLWQRITNMKQWCRDNPDYDQGNLLKTVQGLRKSDKGIFAVEVTDEIL